MDMDASVIGMCDFDESEDHTTTLEGDLSMGVEGWICPTTDDDWYDLEVPASDRLVRIQLAAGSNRSPVEPVWAIYDNNGGELGDPVADPGPGEGVERDDTTCIDPGSYFLEIRDRGDDNRDIRDPYTLTVTTSPEPDMNEPNDDAAGAPALTSGTPVTGYIACAGDRDFFDTPPVTAGQIIIAQLEVAEETAILPTLTIRTPDGELLLEEANLGSERGPTNILVSRVLQDGGIYSVEVSANEGNVGDAETPYTLTISLVTDADMNEPNDTPEEATEPLGSAIGCTNSWTTAFTAMGTIGSAADDDWFRLPVNASCRGALMEATVTVSAGATDQESWERQEEVQAQLALVRVDTLSTCDADSDCSTLANRTCSNEWDCEGYFNTCITDACAGATQCLGSNCLANQASRNYTRSRIPSMITEPPPPNTATLVAPILDNQPVFIRVTDFQGDGGDPQGIYTLTVRLRNDPDGNDTYPGNGLYTPRQLVVDEEGNDPIPVRRSESRATPITVQAAGGCSNMANWTRGAISYEFDYDWFTFTRPGAATAHQTIRIHWQVDAGPVTPGFFTYYNGDFWITRGLSAGSSGVAGSTEEGQCVYLPNNVDGDGPSHSGDYYILVRDRGDSLGEGGNDADPDQGYAFCIENVGPGCQLPCMVNPMETGGGCNNGG